MPGASSGSARPAARTGGRAGGRATQWGLLLRFGRAGSVPAGGEWLGPLEREACARLRLPKRKGDWLLGRWTAKQLVRSWLRRQGRAVPEPAEIQVVAAPDGAPELHLGHDGGAPLALSISHSGGLALAAVTRRTAVGCDVEAIEQRTTAFIEDYFTLAEARRVLALPEAHRVLAANLVWSAKESALKALRQGLRLDTRCVEVDWCRTGSGRGRLRVRYGADGTCFHGSWRQAGGHVATVLTAARP
jgi:4'-phosphopantetheinyl transferase